MSIHPEHILSPQRPATDPEGWVDSYGDYLFRYAWSRLRDTNAAEEVVQETFLSGVRFRDQFQGAGSERGWLLGILKRKIVDHVRRRQRYDRDGASWEDEPDPSVMLFDRHGNWRNEVFRPGQQIETAELWDIVQECLQHLPQGQADVFTLSVMEELDTDEICNQLQITPSNLWVRLHRARLGLAKCVGSKWFSPEEAARHAE